MSCLFCRIIHKEIPAKLVFESGNVIGFKDIAPQAKEHYLFIHKNHSENVNQMMEDEISDIFSAIKKFTIDSGLETSGFRVVTNTGPDAGQTVFHAHFHVLGAEPLRGFGAH